MGNSPELAREAVPNSAHATLKKIVDFQKLSSHITLDNFECDGNGVKDDEYFDTCEIQRWEQNFLS
jgi:hypothetical protein